jgi:rRNA maturation RNase YbeY
VRRPLSARAVQRIVDSVLRAERRAAERSRRRVDVTITFLGPSRMQALNRQWKDRDAPTDVLAFPLPGPGGTVTGDVYICPAVARASAREHAVPVRQELIRLVVHGTLHVLGYDHPDGPGRTRCPMWRRQERYVKALA